MSIVVGSWPTASRCRLERPGLVANSFAGRRSPWPHEFHLLSSHLVDISGIGPISITQMGVSARPIPWPGSVATSVTFPSRRIGRADGLEWAFLSYFTKKPSVFLEIKPAVHPSLSAKFSKNPQILPKPTHSPLPPDEQYFPKDPLHFLKINSPSFLSLRNYHWKTLEFYLNYVTICSNRYYYNSNTIRTIRSPFFYGFSCYLHNNPSYFNITTTF